MEFECLTELSTDRSKVGEPPMRQRENQRRIMIREMIRGGVVFEVAIVAFGELKRQRNAKGHAM